MNPINSNPSENTCRLLIEVPSQTARRDLEKKVYEAAIRSSMFTQQLDHRYFHRVPDIIILVGTSTAGKSTIVNELKNLELNRYVTGIDSASHALTNDWMKKHFPEQYALLNDVLASNEDLLPAVFEGKFSFKEGVPLKVQDEAKRAANHVLVEGRAFESELGGENADNLMTSQVVERARRGENSILDVVGNVEKLVSSLKERHVPARIRIALAYCPLEELSKRMMFRNIKALESGNLGDQRVGVFPLQQFGELFRRSRDGETTVGQLERSTVDRVFSKNFDDAVSIGRVGRERPHEMQKQEGLTKLISRLGFIALRDSINISPRGSVNYLLNTSQLTPLQSARILHNDTSHFRAGTE